MSLLKYVDRLSRMHGLIMREATGPPEEFAERLNLSLSMLMLELQDMKELGASIAYCHKRRSYYYIKPFALVIGRESAAIKGGLNARCNSLNMFENNYSEEQSLKYNLSIFNMLGDSY